MIQRYLRHLSFYSAPSCLREDRHGKDIHECFWIRFTHKISTLIEVLNAFTVGVSVKAITGLFSLSHSFSYQPNVPQSIERIICNLNLHFLNPRPLHANLSVHILHAVFFSFPVVLMMTFKFDSMATM